MNSIKVFSYTRWHPFKIIGLTGPIWSIHKETVIATWALLIFAAIAVYVLRIAFNRSTIVRFMVSSFVRYFMDLCTETMGFFHEAHFSFVTALFTFILLCNTVTAFFPWLEEPTSDLNTTFAFGISSFVYIQIASVQAVGIREYLKEYFTPPFMFPLHIMGKLASVVSISFRLFGNIFGGGIITQIYNNAKMGSFIIETGLLLSGINLLVTLFFGVFEGLIQAFVFAMLTLTYLAIGMQEEEEA